MGIRVEVEGIEEARMKFDQVARDLSGPPFEDAMHQATLIVTRDAKINAPVDTGRLRASITPEVVTRDTVVQGIVGSNVEYAPFQELGTKYIKPRRFLYRALVENAERIYRLLGDTVARIVRK